MSPAGARRAAEGMLGGGAISCIWQERMSAAMFCTPGRCIALRLVRQGEAHYDHIHKAPIINMTHHNNDRPSVDTSNQVRIYLIRVFYDLDGLYT